MKNLKKLRKQNKLSQKELGKIFHAAQNTVSQWENAIKMPSYEIIEEIADYFNVTVDYLLGREEKPSENPNDLSNKIMELFNHLDEKHQQQVIEYTRFVLSLDDDEQN
jgi:transcriptional regulator with XRE-family HTH domain